jgi:hypothetical protein
MTTETPYTPYLAAHLEPGERLLAACASPLARGRTFSGGRATGAWGSVEQASDKVGPTSLTDWLLFGQAAGGDWDSAAARLFFASAPDAAYAGLLAVTDRRLLWCHLTAQPLDHWTYRGPGGKPVPDDLVRVVFSTGRDAVAGARVGRHRLRPGRLWITFGDGSWVAFAGGRRRVAGHQGLVAVIGQSR